MPTRTRNPDRPPRRPNLTPGTTPVTQGNRLGGPNPDRPALNPQTPTNPNPTPIHGGGDPFDPTPDPFTPNPGDFLLLRQLLTRYGLGSLYDTAVEWMTSGFNEDEITARLWDTQEFHNRFRGIFDREQNGLPAISPEEYLATENQMFQTLRELGYPPGFYDDPSDFATAIGHNVSLNEFRQRAEAYADVAAVGREEIRNQLAQQMGPDVAEALDGLTDSELAAWTMDPDRALPILRQRISAAQVSASAVGAGFGGLSYDEATRLTGAGLDEGGARQAFGALAAQGDVTRALAGETDEMSRDAQIGVVSGDAAALTELERRRRGRLGAFEGSGSFAGGREGLGGLGRS